MIVDDRRVETAEIIGDCLDGSGALCGEITEDEAPILSALRLFPLYFGGSLLRLDVALEVVEANTEEVGRALDRRVRSIWVISALAMATTKAALGRLVFRT